MTLLQLFYRFLKINNIYHLYKVNMNIRTIQDGDAWYNINNINNVRAFTLLSNAFDWEETNEKFNFWCKQSVKWEKIICEYYKTIETEKGATYYYDVLTYKKVMLPNNFISLINKHKFFKF